MKKIIITLSILIFALQAFAQSPYKISYQAVIRDAGNGLVVNTEVGTQISILQGSATGTAVFVETHTDTTNDNGLLSLEIGGGTVVSGSMVDIDWSAGPYFIQTETDPTGGTTYSITGVSQLASVPFAFQTINADTAWYARTAGEADLATNALTADVALIADSATKVPGCGLAIGDTYQGGIIFYLEDNGCHGLIAAPSDQSAGATWNNGTNVVTNATRTAIYGGYGNTERIVIAQGFGTYAASICSEYIGGGFADWYLPHTSEMNLMYQQKNVIGGFTNNFYWNSGEIGTSGAADAASVVNFDTGVGAAAFKNSSYPVRAIRRF